MRIKHLHPFLVLVVVLLTLSMPALALDATWNAATDVPVTASSYTAGGTVNLTLNFAPPVGTDLTVVNNTGAAFISGTFSNLQQGQAVTLSYGGKNYSFIVNYYGGTGNDLVLQWPNLRPFAWGYDQYGQFGNNSTVNSSVPTSVLQSGVLAGKIITAVAAGGNHSLALCSDGTLAAWGANQYGQLGNSGIAPSTVPVAVLQTGVLAGKTVVAISAGLYHSLALCSDGTMAAWGNNSSGQLGNNGSSQSTVPVAVLQTGVLAGKTVVAISAGEFHNLALCSDGTTVAWGRNLSGQLGNNSSISGSKVPVAVLQTSGVLSGKTVIAISAGQSHSLALCSDGTLATWGDNGYGQLGNSIISGSKVPVAVIQTGVLAGKTVAAISAGQSHNLVLCSDGTVVAWGSNQYGQLGNNGASQGVVPSTVIQTGVLAGKTVVAVSAGAIHSLALCSDGTMAAWGSDQYGQLGNNDSVQSNVPVLVSTAPLATGERFVAASSGQSANHTLALVASPLRSNTNLAALSLGSGALRPTFSSGITSYTATTTANTTSVIPYVADSAATVRVNGTAVPAGSASPPISIPAGGNTPITIVVTAQDGTTATYTVTVTSAPLSWTYNSPLDVPDAGGAYIASGTATLALNFAPSPGTSLTVVKNTGPAFISGSFSNLAQGQKVTLNYGGVNYNFIVNYYGGAGRDLVLQWANVRPVAWGSNFWGQLGSNDPPAYRQVPVPVLQSGALAGKTVTAVSMGQYFSVALCSDGTLAAWGENGLGQLGNNSMTNSAAPVAVVRTGALSGKSVISVATGESHVLALCSDGTIAAWGYNGYGQLGNNTTTNSQTPVAVDLTGVLAGKMVVAIAAGTDHSLALCSDGTLAAWGVNSLGELGNNTMTNSSAPVAVVQSSGPLLGKTIISVTAGAAHTLVLCSDGTVAAWGYNGYGQLGNTNVIGTSSVPVAVTQTSGTLAGKTVTAVAAGSYHSLALCSDGTVAGWGYNYDGELGNPGSTSSSTPAAVVQDGVLAGKTITAVAAGWYHSLAFCSDGTLAAWGENDLGALGNNNLLSSSTPVLVATTGTLGGKTPVALFAGYADSAVLCSDGTLTAWGFDAFGQLGDGGSFGYSQLPEAVLQSGALAGKTITALSAGGAHTLALCSDGTLAAWGSNSNGQLGNNSTTNSNVPATVDQTGVLAGKTVVAVAAGSSHSLALCSDGTVAAWGLGGLLGNNSTGQSAVPVAVIQDGVLSGKVVTGIAAGSDHSLALCSDGTVVAWGSDSYGQLGNNSTNLSYVPVTVMQNGVLSGKTVTAIAAGFNYSLALCADGTLAAWGGDNDYQLGADGFIGQSAVPIAVFQSGALSGKTVTAICAGEDHNLVLCSDGTLATWGYNGASANIVPTAIVQTSGPLAGRTVVAIRAGADHDLALCSDGTLATWGDNFYGQLGVNSTNASSLPVLVSTSTLAAGEGFASVSSGSSANHTLALVAEPPSPLAATLAATSITSTSVTLNGTVNADGNSTVVSFDYGTDATYGNNVAATPGTIGGSVASAVGATLTGLIPGTTYHFRVHAVNAAGTGYGGDFTFTTPATPQDWRSRWYGVTSNTGDAADDADPYGTGIPNLAVFALLGPAQNPATASIAQLPSVQMNGSSLFISFNQPPGVTGVTYGAEWSATLQNDWQPVPDTGTGTLHIFSVPIGGDTQLFMRIKVTEP